MKNSLKNRQVIFFVIFGIFLLFVAYGLLVEPYQVKIRHFKMKADGMYKVLENKTAIHLSDLHLSKIRKREKKILTILEDLNPDFIFLTGDYVKWSGDYKPALTFLSKLKANIGVWAVMGDYDYSYSRNSCLFCHEQGSGKPTRQNNIRFLRNKVERVSLPDGDIWFGGIDQFADASFAFNEKMPYLKENPPAIILSHSPLIFDLIDKNQDVIILAGDTHGGQIPLPSWLWSILGYEKCARYNQGFFEEGRKKMYVSQGIGTSHIPFRLFSPPELMVLHF